MQPLPAGHGARIHRRLTCRARSRAVSRGEPGALFSEQCVDEASECETGRGLYRLMREARR